MLRLNIDGQLVVAQHLARCWTDRSDDHASQCSAERLFQAKLLGHPQQVGDLVSAGDDQNVALAGNHGSDVVGEGRGVFGQVPLIDPHVDHLGAARFETGDQAAVGDAIFLKAHRVIRDCDAGVDRSQELAPGVRLRHAVRRLEADLRHRRHRLWPAANRCDVSQRIDISLALDVLLDRRQEMPKADAGQEDHDVDLACDQSVSEVNRFPILLNRHFAHARANEWQAAEFLYEPGHFRPITAF